MEYDLSRVVDRFGLVFDGLPALVTLMTPAGAIASANRKVVEYFGETLEQLQARPDGSTFFPDDWPVVEAAWAESSRTGDTCDFEARQRGADGNYRWFNIYGFPLRDEVGSIILWYFLQIDIDERKRAEALLAGEKRLLELIARSHPLRGVLEELCRLFESTVSGAYCSVVLVDPTGALLEHGVAPSLPASFIDSINGRPVNADSGPCAMASFFNVQVIAEDLRSETRWADYAWPPMALAHGINACWSTPISSTAGKVLGAFAIYYDEPRTPTALHQSLIQRFTHIASIAIERMRNEEALRRTEALLTEAQHLSSTGSFSWRVASDRVSFSEQTYRTYGFDADAPVTLDLIATRIHPDDMPLIQEIIEIARRTGGDLDYEFRLKMPDASIKHLHLVAHAARTSDGDLEYIGAIQDVTQRRTSEEALSEVRAELARVARVTSLGALTASIAHEVNQPLSGIITNAGTCLRMLDADPPNIAGARQTASRTIRDGNRASDVIKRLRSLFVKTNTTIELVNLNEAAREVIALSRSDLRRNRIVVRTEFADRLPAVTGDRVQLQQVILNLVLNASDAMSRTAGLRRLVIETAAEGGDRVRLTVKDVGTGISLADAERLFDAFYTTKTGGMGIGLSVSRSIIDSHLGRLWAEPNTGRGAAFSFSLPCSADVEIPADDAGAVPALSLTGVEQA